MQLEPLTEMSNGQVVATCAIEHDPRLETFAAGSSECVFAGVLATTAA